jgi:phosphoglycolate phosphatase-like HAD superfamily hydrolase
MPHVAIFDVDGTLVDSVDLHAQAWQEAFGRFGHPISFQEVRSQIGKGGDQLIPFFLSKTDQDNHGEELEVWRGNHFKENYLPLVRPFSAVPELMRRVRAEGLKIGIASSANESELNVYLAVAGITNLIDVAVSGDEVEKSKPSPDVFQVALRKMGAEPTGAMAVGDTPYDAAAAGKAGIPTIGFLSGGFREGDLRQSGCVAIYPGPSALFACFTESPLRCDSPSPKLP